METRKLAVALIAFLNAVHEAAGEAVELIEKEMSGDGDDDDGKASRPSRAGKAGGKDTSKNRSSKKDKDDDGDEPSEDDMVDAVRGAQKVLESADIKKILKKHGKAERASEIEPENRQAAIDALEKAVEEAE